MANQKMTAPRNGTVPNPDPTDRTIEQLLREIATAREIVESKAAGQQEVVETRFNGMDKAIELLQKSAEKIPQYIKDSVAQLESLHNEKFSSIEALVDTRFDGIDTQFAERDKRTEQLSLADKTAIAAALQAQKEAAGAQNESNAAANTKMESNFAKLIDQGQALLLEVRRNTEAQINDLKSRLDKGEGRSNVLDPSIATRLDALTLAGVVQKQTTDVSGGFQAGKLALWAIFASVLGLIFGAIGFVSFIISHMPK